MRTPLPIDSQLPRVVEILRAGRNLVLTAEPGAGKTTRVPRVLLDAGLPATGECWVLEPRRLAARLAAARVADGLVSLVDMGGRIHCLESATGQVCWVHETGAEAWGAVRSTAALRVRGRSSFTVVPWLTSP